MAELELILSNLSPRHRAALQWFRQRAGTEQPWPMPLDDGTLLATLPKGIYKPEWSRFALSIRQMLHSPYPDREPAMRIDGTWSYAYYQEGADPADRDQFYTNVGLLASMRDGVPVGVLRQVSGKPKVRYHVHGLALVVRWDAGYFFLEGFSANGIAREGGVHTEVDVLMAAQERARTDKSPAEPGETIDARERALASIVLRRGQGAFRDALVAAYAGRCAITGYDAVEALEAAHITPYLGPHTNHVSNGLLLRADLHTLFDLGLLAIHEETLQVLVARSLARTSYGQLHGQHLRLPLDSEARPSRDALARHRAWAGL